MSLVAICSCLSTLSHSILSDREDAGSSLSGKSALVFEAADSRVVTFTGQADVSVLTSGPGFAVGARPALLLLITQGKAF